MPDRSRPAALSSVVEANYRQFLLSLTNLPGSVVRDTKEICLFATGVDASFFNGVVRTQLAAESVDPGIRAVLEYFNAQHLPMIWRVGPSARPLDLGSRLEHHGLIKAPAEDGLAIELATLPAEATAPSDFIIERVRDPDSLGLWVEAFGNGFGIPTGISRVWFDYFVSSGFGPPNGTWRLYLALADGRPIATASLFLAGQVAGVHHVSTVPTARRLGVGTRMTLRVLSDARRLGFGVGVLQATRMALGLYEKLGFRKYCEVGQYASFA